MWSLSSCSLPSAVSMPRFSTERILRDRPGRFQMSFQQVVCRNSVNSRLKSSTLVCDLSTQALPRTSVRVFKPSFSRSLIGLESISSPFGKGATILSPMKNRLDGRIVIITGGGHGIGRAYAKRLAEEGAKIVIAELDGPAGERVAAELGGLAVQTDVADERSANEMARRTVERFGRIDILVNNAALFATVPMSRAPFDQIDPSEWDRMMAVNLRGTWLACRAVIPQMRKQKYGKIINISSGTALKGSASRIHYVTSKAGILGFTRTLAMEVGKDNICVNCIAPGSTLSEENAGEDIVKYRQAAASTRALQRMQKPEDLVGAVAFFASPDSDFITGQTLVVDGGACMH